MLNPTDPWQNMRAPDFLHGSKLQRYEETAVIQLLRMCGHTSNVAAMRREVQQITGDPDTTLTFAAFAEVYPLCDVRFHAVLLSAADVNRSTINWFKRVSQSPLYKCWAEFRDTLADLGEPGVPAIVFPVPGLSRYCVLSACSEPPASDPYISVLVRGQRLYFETFDSLRKRLILECHDTP